MCVAWRASVRAAAAAGRWGILPGQDTLVMDITSLEVPEEDFSSVREMQMSAMEWDESGEAALKKGFRKGKRTKFRGEWVINKRRQGFHEGRKEGFQGRVEVTGEQVR